MRTVPCAVVLIAAAAWGQGTTYRPDPTDAPTAQTVTPRQRLIEIDQELYGLAFRPTAGSVFVASLKKLTPWFVGAALPLGALAVIAGSATPRQTAGVNATSDANVTRLFGIGTAVLGAVLLLELIVCAGTVIDHWVSEADTAKARAARVTELEAERAALNATSRPSQP